VVRATARTSLPSSGAGLAFCHSLEGKADETFIREFFKGKTPCKRRKAPFASASTN